MAKIKLKGLIDEDFLQYKKASMFLIFPYCSGKCNDDAGCIVCQNYKLKDEEIMELEIHSVVERYLNNPITSAIVCGGLEPFDTGDDLYNFIIAARQYTNDDIVIYTGYNEDEISEELKVLSTIPNIIIKYGRFIPDQTPKYDEVLGVQLASPNQYGVKIS